MLSLSGHGIGTHFAFASVADGATNFVTGITTVSSSAAVSKIASLPPVTRWFLRFQAWNSCNFTIAIGAPMVLTARYLGANEFHIGIMTALPVLLTALQLFATNFVERLGFRRIMLMGWSTRSFMLLLISPLPFIAHAISPEHRVYLVWAMIFSIGGYATIRGLVSGSWLPWLTAVLPVSQRGNYLGREQRTMNLSAFITLVLSSWFLGDKPGDWRYAVLFVVAWLAGMGSVHYLGKAEDTPPTSKHDAPRRRLPDLMKGVRRAW
ncbi:MAG: MFS transporter, partial [Candidatus Sumerlaeota bacterium]